MDSKSPEYEREECTFYSSVLEFRTNSWNWARDQPDPTQGECGRTVLGKQQIVDSAHFEFNGAINVSLADCSLSLPFICKKQTVEVVVKAAHFCEDNWYGNQYVPVCYQIFKEPLPFQDALASCESHDGSLALASTTFERKMISAVFTYYESTDTYVANKNVDQLWVNQTNSTTPCSAYFRNLTNVVSDRNCDESNMYICTKSTRFLGYANFEIGGPYLDQDELLEYSPFTRLTLYGKTDRALNEGEVGFVQTYASLKDSTNWIINGNVDSYPDTYYFVTHSNPKNAPYYINVSLPVWKITDNFFYNFIMLSTGIGHIYIYIYIAYIDFWQTAFENTGLLPMPIIHEFNLLKDKDRLSEINAYTGEMYGSSILPAGLEGIAKDFRGTIESVSTRTLKMRIFVAPTDSRNASTDLEQVVLQIVKEHLRTSARKIKHLLPPNVKTIFDEQNFKQILYNTVNLTDPRFIRDFIASEIWDQNGFGDLIIGINLSNTTAITIDKDSLSSVKRPDDVDIPTAVAAIYLDENLVKVAAARLTKNGRDIVQLGNDSVTIVFQVFEDHNNPVCSYWDYYADEGAGGWRTDGCSMTSYVNNTVVCKCNHLTNFAVLIALLHYFILVSFMWMLVEGILQYLRFVKVLGTYVPKFMMKTMILAWGIPLIPVIIVLAMDYDMYYGGKGYCWLSETPLLYAFIIPIAVVIFANLIVFTLVMCKFLRRKTNIMISNQSELNMAFLHFQAALSIFVILGLTWVFGFMTVDDTRIVFHYLFAIFNAFQGLFVFFFFTLREKKVRNAWRKLCCPRSVYKSTTSSDEHKGKTTNSDTKSTDLVGNS
ncbi:AGRG2-like protein [Mya arenaria]|uniref:AGRG2-like protein n=1 Tax=Mya arenaria TaxID=6604 RepID=A0ABY7EJZ5_MYAAR|nr:AGRG2-like protein [Mya arenaria]